MSFIITLSKQAKERLSKYRSAIAQTLLHYLTRKEDNNMVDLYVALIISGRRTFAQVPDRYKDAVRSDLAALGLDENGSPTGE